MSCAPCPRGASRTTHVLLPSPLLPLQLEGLYRMTDHILQYLPIHTPRLAALNVRMCNCLSATALLRMVVGQQVSDTAADGSSWIGECDEASTAEPMEGMHQVGLASCVRPGGGSGCTRLRSLHLGGVMGEAETTRLVRCIKKHRPTMFMRL